MQITIEFYIVWATVCGAAENRKMNTILSLPRRNSDASMAGWDDGNTLHLPTTYQMFGTLLSTFLFGLSHLILTANY